MKKIILLSLVIGIFGCSKEKKEKTDIICKEWIMIGTSLNPNSNNNYNLFNDITFTNFPKRYSTEWVDDFGTVIRNTENLNWKWTNNLNSISLKLEGITLGTGEIQNKLEANVELLTDSTLWLNFGDSITAYYNTTN
tara:strand:+ start:1027 stop:1437 length:411 start_codon:yes stop_codon:yes gene_type:complete